MKKFPAVFLAFWIVLSILAGCGKTATSAAAETAPENTAEGMTAPEETEPTEETGETDEADDEVTFTALVEIPQGSNIKYETDSAGNIIVDRFMAMSVTYP